MKRPSQRSEQSIQSWTVPDEWHDSDAREGSEGCSGSYTMPDLPLPASPGGSIGSDDGMFDVDVMMPGLVELVARMLGHC